MNHLLFFGYACFALIYLPCLAYLVVKAGYAGYLSALGLLQEIQEKNNAER